MTAELSPEERATLARDNMMWWVKHRPTPTHLTFNVRAHEIRYWNSEYLHYNELCKPSKASRE